MTNNEDIQKRVKKLIQSNQSSPARLVCNQLTFLTDILLLQQYDKLPEKESYEDRFCIVAIGGYGRKELSPHSDIDILYLYKDLEDSDLNLIIQHFNNFLYNKGKDIGYAVRTVEESHNYLDNLHTFNAILDSRFLLGSRAIFEDFEDSILQKLPENLIREFSQAKIESLRNHVESYTPLHISEPNLKNGSFGLRDIQSIYWMEKSIRNLHTLSSLAILPVFNHGEVHLLENAYDFYLKIRNALHVLNGRKVDTLSIPLQPVVANFLGFGEENDLLAIDKMMRLLYSHESNVYNFISMYLDYQKIQQVHLETYNKEGIFLRIYDGSLYPDRLRTLFSEPRTLYRDILQVFSIAQRDDLRISPILLNEIRFASNFLEENFTSSKSAIDIFRSILKYQKNAGRILTDMHRAGVLGKILPEFGATINFPLFSYHHHYSIDEHTLLILRELDRFYEKSFEIPDVQDVYNTCTDIDILILSILVHDAGKVKEGDHCQYGAELAMNIGERMGLNEDEVSLFKFLVEWHIQMSEISSKRDTSDPHTLQKFARTVGTVNRLNLLYILTIIDTKSVGKATLTNWKRSILKTLYENTLEIVKIDPIEVSKKFSQKDNYEILLNFLMEKEEISNSDSQIVIEFCEKMSPESFVVYFTPRRILDHFLNYVLLKKQDDRELHISYSFEPSYVSISITHLDGKLFLGEICGCATSSGFNVTGLRTFKNENGYVIEILQVTDFTGAGKVTEGKLSAFCDNLTKLYHGEKSVDELLREPSEWVSYNKIPEGMVEERIDFSNDLSPDTTVLEVRVPDSPGLLYRLIKTILSFDLQLHFVKVSTSADYAFDSFYLQEKSGEKITDLEKISQIKVELENAIQEKVQTHSAFLTY
ncbi:MAG: HD domain-containing protein [Leptospiraceae bacterium]|nr:HD domain-containing protein [Leptospiraceae bacterium]